MSKLGVLGGLFGKKVSQAADGVISAIVAMDPVGASEVQLERMEKELQKLATKLAEYEQNAIKERKEAEAALEQYEKQKSAAGKIKAHMDANPDQAESLTPKLMKLIDDTKLKKTMYDKEVAEADAAERLAEKMDTVLKMKFDQIEKARRAFKENIVRLEAAKMEQVQLSMDEQINKLATEGNEFDIIGASLAKKAAKEENKATGMKKVAELGKSSDVMNDDEINAILSKDTPTKSIDELMAEL